LGFDSSEKWWGGVGLGWVLRFILAKRMKEEEERRRSNGKFIFKGIDVMFIGLFARFIQN
jgi:hypothetical protein